MHVSMRNALRKRQLGENGEQVDSMLPAGIDVLTVSEFSRPTATMVLTSTVPSSVATDRYRSDWQDLVSAYANSGAALDNVATVV